MNKDDFVEAWPYMESCKLEIMAEKVGLKTKKGKIRGIPEEELGKVSKIIDKYPSAYSAWASLEMQAQKQTPKVYYRKKKK